MFVVLFFWGLIPRCLNIICRLYEDGTECSETSAYKIQTPGNHPKERIQRSEHGESLKSRMLHLSVILCVSYGVRRMPLVETTPHRLSMSVLPSNVSQYQWTHPLSDCPDVRCWSALKVGRKHGLLHIDSLQAVLSSRGDRGSPALAICTDRLG